MKHRLLHSLNVLPVALVMIAGALLPSAGWATTLLVYNNFDAGAGSLRQALNDNFALGSDNLIVFSNIVTGTISLTTGELEINSDVTITGPGAKVLTVSGKDSSRVFNIVRGTVSISGLRIAGGYLPGMGMGAGICNSGDLTLGNCVISGCVCDYVGGGIANLLPGTLLMTNTTVAGNSAAISGGGIYNSAGLTVINCTFSGNNVTESYGGGIYNGGTLRITNSTFSGNSAFSGGGLYCDMDANGTLMVSSCTVASNTTSAGPGGGIRNFGDVAIRVSNTIIAGNGAALAPDVMGAIVSDGYNLIGITNGITGFTNGATSDLLGSANVPANAMLGPLQDNGGSTFTHALKLGSPALDQGNSNGLATDQRGQPRPFDFSPGTNAGDGCDIGAFELGGPRLSIQHAGNNVVLSWPSYYSGFTLESATNLPALNNWNAVTNTPKVVGNYFNVTNVTTDESKLYRLILP